MAELQTRKPTGKVAFPLVLLEGEDKAGKTFALCQFSASPRVGRTFILDLGDGTVDEYATLGDFEVLVHDGTWTSIIGQVEAAAAVPSDPERPNVIAIDSGTQEWNQLKAWAESRARGSKRAIKLLKEDPNAEIDVSMPYWNDAKGRWAQLLQVLKTFPGIGVITATGREVAKVENGQPVAGQTEWSIDIEKTTTSWVSAWVRIVRPHQARLIGVRSLTVDVPLNGLDLPDAGMLDHLVFEVLGAGGESFGESTAVGVQAGVPIVEGKVRLLGTVKASAPALSDDEAKAEAVRLWTEAGFPSGDGEVSKEALTALLLAVAEGTTGPTPPDDGGGAPDGHQAAQNRSGAAPEPPSPDPPPGPTEGHTNADGSHCPGPFPQAPDVVAYLDGLKGTDLANVAQAHGLSKTGKVDEIRDRLKAHFGLVSVSSYLEETARDAFPGATQVGPDDIDGLPEVRDVPEGWTEERCICGEPIMFERGNYAATVIHLDPALDGEHEPEQPF